MQKIGLFTFLVAATAFADGPADNIPENVRRVPPLGVEVPAEVQTKLEAELESLKTEIATLAVDLKDKPELLGLIPDVEVFHKAVRDSLVHQEFQKEGEFKLAIDQLAAGRERAKALREGKTPWLAQSGPVVRGYRSKIDGSVQPYGLEIPANYDFGGTSPVRLDFWFHGRGERTNEVAFIEQRRRGGGKIGPTDRIVLHPYARFSNANKFAGEIDCLEALEHAKQHYRIDDDRVFVRGFSMGGAACWQFAVHYADRWAGAQPGAGFSETEDFLKTFQGETLNPSWWEKKLWRLYDCTDWAINLSNCPTVAYSGEIDSQKQAADMMEKAMADAGMNLVHLIGPKTAHAIHPDSLVEIESRLDSIARSGRNRVPATVRLATYTLRYNRMHWVQVDALTEHWERGTIEAAIRGVRGINVATDGIDAFSIRFDAGECPLDLVGKPAVVIDGASIKAPPVASDRSWKVSFRKEKGKWRQAMADDEAGLRKKHLLQGPIDDAFMDSFLMVSPTGQPLNEKTGAWVGAEMDHAITHWRQQFRGNARVKHDSDVSEADIADRNLVLWGDRQSNAVLAKIADKLPIGWDSNGVKVGDQSFDAGHHVVAMIFPNPLNSQRYVVLNSGFTYREYDYLNNARQTPKLPDWAVIDVDQPMTSQRPGGIPAAGFFDEKWELKAQPED